MQFLVTLLLDLSAYLSTHYANHQLENNLIKWASSLIKKRFQKKNTTVAILGASFNPITLAHVDLIHIILPEIAKIKLIPTAQSPLKTSFEYASAQDRLHMLNLVLQNQFTSEERTKIEVDTLELTRHSPSWMVMTLTALIFRHRAHESYRLICGYDHIELMLQWYRWQDLANLCELHFYPRAEVDIWNRETVEACILLCQAGIKMTIVFNDNVQKQRFESLCAEQASKEGFKSLALLYDANATIRPYSATTIRMQYQNGGANLNNIPEGISAEVHEYILAHNCYNP